MRKINHWVLPLIMTGFSALFMTNAWALTCQKSAPVAQMRCIADHMLGALEKNKSRLGNSNVVDQIINRQVVPYFDVNTMARSVVGRRFWYADKGASAASLRDEFTRRFKQLIINTYAAAIEQYDGDKVKFYPLRQQNKSYRVVSVSSVIQRPNGQNIAVKYMLRNRGGQWVIFDFSIENISMVQSYRSQFSADLNSGGLAKLVSNLRARQNR